MEFLANIRKGSSTLSMNMYMGLLSPRNEVLADDDQDDDVAGKATESLFKAAMFALRVSPSFLCDLDLSLWGKSHVAECRCVSPVDFK